MRTRLISCAVTTLVCAAAFAVAVPAADATAQTVPHLVGLAAGSTVTAVGGAVTSGPTAPAGIDTLHAGQHSSNQIAQAQVAKLLDAGAITTDASSVASGGGLAVVAHARTTGVSLLGGAISVDAVDTTATSTLNGTSVTSNIATTFVGLKIAGRAYPATVGKNTTVTIPGVASVTLNYTKSKTGNSAVSSQGAGLLVTILGNAGPLRSVIALNPVSAEISQVGVGYAPLRGYAFATGVDVYLNGLFRIVSGPTGAVSMPVEGTKGRDISNNTAAVNLPGIASVGAVGSTANGTVSDARTTGTTSAHVAKVSLFGGVISADAVTAHATVTKNGANAPVASGGSELVNLIVGGTKVPVNAAPNTVIPLAGLGTVTVNAVTTDGRTTATATALTVHLTTARAGLPAGADVYVASATVGLAP